MSISFLRNGPVSAPDDNGTAHAASVNAFGSRPDGSSPSSVLRGLPRFERGLRKVLPRPLADSVLRLAPRPWTKGPAADAAPGFPIETAGVGHEFTGNRDGVLPHDAKRSLVTLARAAEGFQSERARRAEIEHILDECEAGRAPLDDELAGGTFRLIASLQDTCRDDLLDRALDIICCNPQLNVSPQALMSDGWLWDESVKIFDSMYPVVIEKDDTPERAAQLGTLIAWIDRFLPSEQRSAIEKVVEGIRETDAANRFAPLTQLRTLADRLSGDLDRARTLVLMQELGGRWLRECSTPDKWGALFPALHVMFPDPAEADERTDSSFSAATERQPQFAGAR